MDIIRNSLHAPRELARVGYKGVIVARIPPCRPAVVQNDVLVAQVAQAELHHQLRGGRDQRVGDGAGKGVPIV
jgi:hypothetical protein